MSLKQRLDKLDGGSNKLKMFVVLEGSDSSNVDKVINDYCKETGYSEEELFVISLNTSFDDSDETVEFLYAKPY
jgi:cell division protein YceG involved in septum cleavage